MNKDGDIKNYINNLQENEISQIYNLPDEKLKQYKIRPQGAFPAVFLSL